MVSSMAAMISSLLLKVLPFSLPFRCSKRKKSHGAKSGEYGGCGSKMIRFFESSCVVVVDVCGRALSQCNFVPERPSTGLVVRMFRSRCGRMALQKYSLVYDWSLGDSNDVMKTRKVPKHHHERLVFSDCLFYPLTRFTARPCPSCFVWYVVGEPRFITGEDIRQTT